MAFLDFSTLKRRRAVCQEEVVSTRRSRVAEHARAGGRPAGGLLRAGGRGEPTSRRVRDRDAALRRRAHDGGARRAAAARRRATCARWAASLRRFMPRRRADVADPVGRCQARVRPQHAELLALADGRTARRISPPPTASPAAFLARPAPCSSPARRRGASRRPRRPARGARRPRRAARDRRPARVRRPAARADVADDLAFLSWTSALGAGRPPSCSARLPRRRRRSRQRRARRVLRRLPRARAGQGRPPARRPARRARARRMPRARCRATARARRASRLACPRPARRSRSAVRRRAASRRSPPSSPRSGWPVLSSDAARKRGRGFRSTAAGRTTSTRPRRARRSTAIWRARAGGAPPGDGVIVDATFAEPSLRGAFLEGLGERSGLRALQQRPRARRAARERWARERSTADRARLRRVTPPSPRASPRRHSGWTSCPRRRSSRSGREPARAGTSTWWPTGSTRARPAP